MRIPRSTRRLSGRAASVLIIVMWVTFGLVSLAIYFAHSMNLEMRSAANRVAAAEAEQVLNGAARYAAYLLSSMETNGVLPDPKRYASEEGLVGEGSFWFVGRGQERDRLTTPVFGLVDEAARLNVNTATREMLEGLPLMTTELAGAIIDWRDADSDPVESGAEDEVYQRLTPPRRAKNGRFETLEELRLVQGATPWVLFGEDANMNGILDPNENDGDLSTPIDDRDGQLDFGILEYLTVCSRESASRTNGEPKLNVALPQARPQLAEYFVEKFGQQRAGELQQRLNGAPPARSLLEFHLRSGMSASEFATVQFDLTTSTNGAVEGLVNVNTASETVLACIPGIGIEKAPSLVAYRLANSDKLGSMAWLTEVLDEASVVQAGPFVTGITSQYTADVVALGSHYRGHRRVRFTFDTTEGTPKLVGRRDLTHLGWALGVETRRQIALARETGL